MLGWEVMISTERSESTGHPNGLLIASWRTGMGGTDWLDELVKDGKAQCSAESNGYPDHYSAKLKYIISTLSSGVPNYKGTTVIGDDYVIEAGSSWNVEINQTELFKLDREEVIHIEAWDQS